MYKRLSSAQRLALVGAQFPKKHPIIGINPVCFGILMFNASFHKEQSVGSPADCLEIIEIHKGKSCSQRMADIGNGNDSHQYFSSSILLTSIMVYDQ